MLSEMPKEFLSALGRDPSAALRFSGLEEGEKEAILDSARRARDTREIERITERI